ncbi:DinB family protein [Fervidibacillus albus]|uniref:DinB family protein n=1 Tax=Fervidibacillus albus TaxID=2980026 RepID=A0A9E8LSU5_9BACI|nr:DinB family protein [Fervidibacillus albus]WAA08887.1 DinB family protein [Fervidibacillus albus]
MSMYTLKYARNRLMKVLTAATDEQLDFVPDGFNNSIRWNAGHVMVIADRIFSHIKQYTPVLPAHYISFFDMGTKPADWSEPPPSVEEIIAYSSKQMTAIEKIYQHPEQWQLKKPFENRGTVFQTYQDILSFVIFHEGMHFQTMKLYYDRTKKKD